MAHVTVPAARAINRYQVAAAQTSFAVTFPFFSITDLVVTKWVNGAKQVLAYSASPANEGQYAVTGTKVDGGYSNGTVTVGGAGAADCILTIRRSVLPAREVDYAYPSPSIDLRSLNTDQDRAVAMIGDSHYTLQRSIRASEANDDVDLELPPLAPRRVPVVKEDGTGIEFTEYDPDTTVSLAASADTIAKEARDLAASASAAAEQAGVVSTQEWSFTLVAGQQVYGPLPGAASKEEALDLYIGGVRQIGNFEIVDTPFGAGLGIELTPVVSASPGDGELQAGLTMYGNVKGGIVESAIPSQSIFGRHFHDGAIDLTSAALAAGPTGSYRLETTRSTGKPIWVAKEWIDPCDFGAAGNDAADDTAAITAAVAAMPVGGAIFFRPGKIFRISSAISLTKPGAYFGCRESSAIRLMSASADGFVIASQYVNVFGLNFLAGAARTGGAAIRIDGNDAEVYDNRFDQQWISVHIPAAFGATANIKHCRIYRTVANAAGVVIEPYPNGYDISLYDVIMSPAGSSAVPSAGIVLKSAADVSVDSCQILLCARGLDVFVETGKVLASLWVKNSFFDNCGRGVSLGAAGGSIVRSNFDKVWFCSATTDHGMILYTSGVGQVDGTEIVNCEGCGAAANGLNAFNQGVINTRVLGGHYAGSGQSGIAFGTTSSTPMRDFSVQAARCGQSFGWGPNNVGIFVPAAADGYAILGNDARGNTSVNISGAVHAPPTKLFQNNLV